MSSHEQAPQPSEDRVTIALTPQVRQALQHLAEFPLLDAIFGRRSRRFPLGGEIPDGVLAYRSRHAPLPLTELERLLVLTTMGGTTGWHYAIMRHERYAPGSLLVIPVADIAQHTIANLCFFTQNGYCIFDDVHGTQLPGLAAFRGLVDVDAPLPLTFLEQYSLTEATAELATSAYAGTL